MYFCNIFLVSGILICGNENVLFYDNPNAHRVWDLRMCFSFRHRMPQSIHTFSVLRETVNKGLDKQKEAVGLNLLGSIVRGAAQFCSCQFTKMNLVRKERLILSNFRWMETNFVSSLAICVLSFYSLNITILVFILCQLFKLLWIYSLLLPVCRQCVNFLYIIRFSNNC